MYCIPLLKDSFKTYNYLAQEVFAICVYSILKVWGKVIKMLIHTYLL